MTEAPKRIWATINGQRSVFPGSERYLIGGWEGAPREHGREYILATEHDRLILEKDDELERAYARGFHDAQEKAKVEGRFVVEDSAEIARLTAERDAIAALTVERCAEVARATGFSRRDSKAIAASIRSLSPIPPHVAAARVLIPIFEEKHRQWAVSKGRDPADYVSTYSYAVEDLRALADQVEKGE